MIAFFQYLDYMVHIVLTYRPRNPVLTFRYVVVYVSRLESQHLIFRKRLATMVA